MADIRINVGGLGPVPRGEVAPATPVLDVREHLRIAKEQVLELRQDIAKERYLLEVKAARKETKRKRKAEDLDRLAIERDRMMERAHARKAAKRKRKAEDQDRVAHERERMQERAHTLARHQADNWRGLVQDLIAGIRGDGQRTPKPRTVH